MKIPNVRKSDLLSDPETRITVPTKTKEYDYSETYLSSHAIDEKTIKKVESLVRSSTEYKDWVKYLKEELDLNSCPILPNINISKDGVALEMHHYPISLYDIAEAVMRKTLGQPYSQDIDKSAPENKASIFDVANTVMKEHYLNNVGVVPLTTTLHEMSHSRAYVISIDDVSGDFDAFSAKYKPFMSPQALDKLDEIVKESNNASIQAKNKDLLSKIVSEYK